MPGIYILTKKSLLHFNREATRQGSQGGEGGSDGRARLSHWLEHWGNPDASALPGQVWFTCLTGGPTGRLWFTPLTCVALRSQAPPLLRCFCEWRGVPGRLYGDQQRSAPVSPRLRPRGPCQHPAHCGPRVMPQSGGRGAAPTGGPSVLTSRAPPPFRWPTRPRPAGGEVGARRGARGPRRDRRCGRERAAPGAAAQAPRTAWRRRARSCAGSAGPAGGETRTRAPRRLWCSAALCAPRPPGNFPAWSRQSGAGAKRELGVPLPALRSPGEGDPRAVFHLGDGGSQAVGEPGARHGKRALPGRPRWAWSASPEPGGAGRGPRPARCWWGGGSVAAPKENRQPSSRKSGPWGSGDAELGMPPGGEREDRSCPPVTGRKPSAWWPGGREVGAAAGSRGLPPSRPPEVKALGAPWSRREPLRSVKPQSLYMAPARGCSEGRW